MILRTTVLLSLSVLFAAGAAAAGVSYSYQGEIQRPESRGVLCDNIFVNRPYNARFFLTGASGLTAVTHFTAPEGLGFFHGMTLVCLYWGSGDVKMEKKFLDNGLHYHVVAEGLVDQKFLLLEMAVAATRPHDNAPVCQAKADYNGFDE